MIRNTDITGKTQKFIQLLSSPITTTSNQSQLFELNNLLKELCSRGISLQIRPQYCETCMFCKEKLPSFCKVNSDYLEIISCNCCQIVHKSCLKTESLIVSEKTLDERISNIHCLICKVPIPIILIEEAFGENDFRKIKEEMLKKKRLERQREEDMQRLEIKRQEDLSISMALQFLEDDRKIIAQREKNATFECQICFDKKKIDENCITLECDHRFCQECLRNDIVMKMKDKKVKEEDIKCFNCKEPISHFIIQNVLNFKEFRQFEKETMAFNTKNFIRSDEIVVKCQNAKCNNLVIISKKFDVTHYKCHVCGLLFCVRGCTKPHNGKTCEEQKKHENNVKNDQLFDQVKFNEKLRDCPSCGLTVQKTEGCNHMTCICKFEFCYVCGAKYRSCSHC